ncbi:MAG: tetratricopeptide repeat protein [Acidobacteriota bacterium]|nr:tetratricopeptide repeat protein [Acidobacteriota bacterium]
MSRDLDQKVVPFGRPRRVPDPARVAEFAATARRLQEERAASADITRTLASTPREQWARFANDPSWRTSGVLERLSQEIDARLDREPLVAFAISELATSIAAALPDGLYPRVMLAQLRARAWQDRGQALNFLARYDEALEALNRADAQLAAFGTLAHDQAIVLFVRATVLQHLRRYDEAQAALAECSKVFEEHGDTRLQRKAQFAFANLLVRRGDFRTARTLLLELVGDADSGSLSIARQALGWCAMHLNAPHEALDHFNDAMRLSAARGATLDVARAAYGAGSALLRTGALDEALDRLTLARSRFLMHQLIEEAGLSGLEIVEVWMLRDELEAARDLAADIVREFTTAGLNRRAVAALAYLNDAIAASSATPEVVRDVHTFIAGLGVDPNRDFVATN